MQTTGRSTSERDWLVPSAALTLACGTAGFLLMPDLSRLSALLLLPAWMGVAALIACLYGFVRMISLGVTSPLAETTRFFVEEWRRVAVLAVALAVAALNMIGFLWVKSLLNHAVPFHADALLADIDWLLFLGRDPWTVLQWLNFPHAGLIYHPVWFGLIILTLVVTVLAPPSPERSAVLLSYFVLWSLAGPLIHLLLPAAGPVFYERMGLGDRFAGLDGGPETRRVADYLWTVYASRSFGAGSGISAMPSLHVTIAAWMVIAFRALAARWVPPIALAALLIFLLSIALGWHYAIDGVVGAGAAVLSYHALRAFFRRKRAWSRADGAPAAAAARS